MERYWHLLAAINEWFVPPSLAPVFTWFAQALRARTVQPSRVECCVRGCWGVGWFF
ncbi:hypothetical protein [Streptomyces sp. NPDC005017]|uniref:hypothetical protein n=1 Tax=Streptomyces sp. NPDC005017 TaxID=3364706 RepID=UPI0036A11CC6